MDEQHDGVGDRHNGTGIADAARWGREADGADAAWPDVRAALPQPEPEPAQAHGSRHEGPAEEPGRRHAPGLDDDTPPDGTPAVEPPLWREAARFARGSGISHEWEPPDRPTPADAGYERNGHSSPVSRWESSWAPGNDPDSSNLVPDPTAEPADRGPLDRGPLDRGPADPGLADLGLADHWPAVPAGSAPAEWASSAPAAADPRERAPRAEQPAARAEQPAPRAEQPAARAEQPAPRAEQPAPRAEQPAARAEQPTARAEQPAGPRYAASAPVAAPAGGDRPYQAPRRPVEPAPRGRRHEPDSDAPPLGPAGGELPQRVPAEPDVPDVSEPGDTKPAAPPAAAPQLARIADQLRRDDVPAEDRRAEGFDVDAVLDAVRGVAGVRAAALRTSPHGAHTLRLDLSDDADPVNVSRVVARLLQERMGLSAAPQHVSRQVPTPRASPEAEDDTTGGERDGVRDGPGEEVAPPGRHSGGSLQRQPPVPRPRSRPLPSTGTAPRVVIDKVQVSVAGLDATVEVRLVAGHRFALGLASGPAVDSYVVRLAAVSAAKAIDELMREASPPAGGDDAALRCFVEHTGVVPFGGADVAVVVVLLVCGGWVEQLAGSAVVDGDSRHAAVRATLGAVNRRLDALLAS